MKNAAIFLLAIAVAALVSDLTWVSWTKLCERMSLERS